MKRLLLIATMLVATTMGSMAQQVSKWTNPANNTGKPDTVTNTTGITLVARISQKGTVAIQLDIKKVNGTVAGAAYLETSVDADYSPVQWSRVPGADTVVLTDGDNTKIWKLGSDYLHYRIRIVPTGTQKHTAKAFHILKL